MLRRCNPWPSIVDLFAALLLLAFGGMMLLSGLVPHPGGGQGTATPIDARANEIMREAHQELVEAGVPATLRACGRDRCIEVSVHFETDKDVIYQPNERAGLRAVCGALKRALDALKSDERSAMQLLIEGHTDSRPPRIRIPEKEYFLYNWGLSARRAGAVLWEFQGSGLTSPPYNITAVGKAATDNLCSEQTEDCWAKNRRITLRLQVDTHKLERSERGMGK